MVSVEQFETLAAQADRKLKAPPYSHIISEGSLYSGGYYDCVGVVLAGKRLWALSHQCKEGTRFSIPDPAGPMAKFAGSDAVEAMRGKRTYQCVCSAPEVYLRKMIEWLTVHMKRGEKRKDLVARPFAGDKTHLGRVVSALQELQIPCRDPVEKHFANPSPNPEIGGAEGRVLALPRERKILHYDVFHGEVNEYDI